MVGPSSTRKFQHHNLQVGKIGERNAPRFGANANSFCEAGARYACPPSQPAN
jgi:hypothetical protein